MARLTIDAGTIFYDYPQGFDITGEEMVTSLESVKIAGRMGSYIRSYGNPVGEKVITVFGRLYGTSAVDLDDKMEALSRAHTFGAPMTLTDNTLSRHSEVWLAGMRYTDRRKAFIREITLRFICPRGVWGLDRNFVPSVTTASINSTQTIRYAHVTYQGSVPGPAQLQLTPSSSTWPVSGAGQVIWRGRNLIVNSSFEDGVAGKPSSWDTIGGGTNPNVVEWFGRSGARCIKADAPGGVHGSLSQDVAADASSTYSYSVYAALPPGATGSVVVQIQSRTAAGAFLTSTSQTFSVTSANWTRFSVAHTSHANAGLLRCIFRVNAAGEELYLDDVQLERAAVVGEFINTSEARYKHTSFELDSGKSLAFATGDILAVDNVRGRSRYHQSGTWSEYNHFVNGHYFELVPGLNHIEFSPPTAGNLDVEIRHRDLHI